MKTYFSCLLLPVLHKCGSASYISHHIDLILTSVTLTGIWRRGAELVLLPDFLVASLVFRLSEPGSYVGAWVRACSGFGY